MPRQAAPTGADPYRGRKIGKYEILTRLSVGGMAELFLAFTSGPGGFRKFVALKQILPDVKTEEFVRMFLDEARITAAFSHPNIGQVFDLGLEDDELYLAMEFLPGQNLEQVMIAASYVHPLPIGFAARVARDVCLGLHYAHNFTATSGRKVAVVHRDMAPRNVMITYDGVVKVIDFGIAKARGRIARTHVGMVKGTSGYMSPEQVRGQELDGRSDLFTAGVLLHEMLCGRRLFDTTDEDAMMRQIASADIASPRMSNPEVPEALDAVVMRALEKDPARRFATGREFAKAIETAMGPDLFDEESVADLMQSLFAEKRLKTLALLDNASSGDEERVSRVIEALTDEKIREARMPLEDSEVVPTTPMRALHHVEKEAAPRGASSRSASPGARGASRNSGREQPSSSPRAARPFPAPARSSPEAASRKPLPLSEDEPTQIGPAPSLPPESERTTPSAPEARESRRPPRMGVFTLGPSQTTSESQSISVERDDAEDSDVSRVSRVSRALMALQRPSRRGLWIVAAIVLVGLAVLFLPESVRSKLGALFSSAGHWTSQATPASTSPQPEPTSEQPSSEAYEPPPPAKDSAEQAPTKKPSGTPSAPEETAHPAETAHPTEAAHLKKSGTSSTAPRAPKKPVEPVAKPSEGAAEKPTEPAEEPSKEPAAAAEEPAKPPERPKAPPTEAKKPPPPQPQPAEEAPPPEPVEPSVGPAEVDPSIQPVEVTPPSTTDAPH